MAREYTAANSDLTSWGDLNSLEMSGVDYSWHAWLYPEGTIHVLFQGQFQ